MLTSPPTILRQPRNWRSAPEKFLTDNEPWIHRIVRTSSRSVESSTTRSPEWTSGQAETSVVESESDIDELLSELPSVVATTSVTSEGVSIVVEDRKSVV